MDNDLSQEDIISRIQYLVSLDFDKSAIKATIETEFEIKLTNKNFNELLKPAITKNTLPEFNQVKLNLNQTWQRQQAIKKDLLVIYNLLHSNFLLMMQGKVQHEDGSPVMPVKIADLISVANKIMQIDESSVTSQVNALNTFPALEEKLNPQIDKTKPALSEFISYSEDINNNLENDFEDDFIEDIIEVI